MKSKSKLSKSAIKENLEGAFKLRVNGWSMVRFEGDSFKIGFQNGYLMADEIAKYIESAKLFVQKFFGRNWGFFREAASKILLPKLDREHRIELEGIYAGAIARMKKLDLIDIIALNGYYDTVTYHYWLKTGGGETRVPPHCSAFMATGSYTETGDVVAAHNTWYAYMLANGQNIMAAILPKRGNSFLMQTSPGLIYGGTDWYVNDKGLIITETTITGACQFNPKDKPYFARIRKAVQYSSSINEFVDVMTKDNNGGYANDWIVADAKTNEISCLELGARNYDLRRTKDGFFAGSNIALTDKIKAEAQIDYRDKSASHSSRQERWLQLMEANRGKLNVQLAMNLLADHLDTSTKTK